MRHADDDLWFRERRAFVHLADEVLDHLFGGVEVRNYAFPHGTNGFDAAGGTTEHQLGILADGKHFLDAILDVVRNNRRLRQDHAPAFHVDQCVCGSEVDRHIR